MIGKVIRAAVIPLLIMIVLTGCDNNVAQEVVTVSHSYSVTEAHTSRGGLDIYGKIYTPTDAEGPFPAVILSHSANLNADSMASYAAGFASRGFVAYAFDFCGACEQSRSEGSTDDMTIFTEVEDLKAVIDYVSSLEMVDSERIYLFGTSQGGLVTALAAEDCKDRIKGEILLYPAFNIPDLVRMFSGSSQDFNISDLMDMFSGLTVTGSFQNFDVSELMEMFSGSGGISGLFGKGYSQAFSVSLMDYDAYEQIGAFEGKVLIIRGSKDFIVSDDVCRKAADRYSDCTMKTIEGAGHGFNRENYSMGGDFDDEVWEYIDEYLKTR